MKIETKREIGDKVWLVHENRIFHATISVITVIIQKDNYTMEQYSLYTDIGSIGRADECIVFSTKEELIKSITLTT